VPVQHEPDRQGYEELYVRLGGHLPHQQAEDGILFYDIPLSDPTKVDASGNPLTFEWGPNWVEALYPYIERVGKQGDNASVWKCPATRASCYPINSTSASNTYAMNYNLVEQPEGILKAAANTMLCREMDRMYNAELRPRLASTDSQTRPIWAFLTANDATGNGTCKYKLHGTGSNILFADAHVKGFANALMPLDTGLVWDATSGQWWNYTAGNKRTICINP
jgi:prepilin-type processing-associated H-X9-DG protein